ncbi:MAG: hypothetical protein A2268_14835 [Candidatus Raymondbacteria bacterium RifOxyA12_full_50_37]|uniref:Polymerase/histidinol phosphatase N-terminal domain-containing protein n=1 Tax=Candidatus Raymondbacteria bacterium RIFOXYD12_FULL_49_13 TaxID=1817890 RepID=A0A1F7F2H3_UNCRA|nr:MAG: hypothetical protein A2268_14835 [Candidatus Raymondbacteria bacterium RifOxyA12_full_50_37]OGJ87839.1 MAG: hypothetical protein A2350_12780 [Candidatus Raymondbacteria bacterium RifOxyB12_full_50_8]OGJ88693.1 MAG: hypothetical protein A2248_20770 [Candidatus Raymondbacteria bacterium RIFOXYA2_FULL_49_16]OGK00865.1 MAG: hypothetical protein A2519_08025 [Candidatus Raymondbacteria bacterium RIFOXYD12_FULL_49_13]OGP41730.1 MAG: hypothetical protein A2324_07860 [Candidatus Raymondbacteria 
MAPLPINWCNPYAGKGRLRLKGNLHTHTDASQCGRIPITRVLKTYEKMGYGFLSITDHDMVTPAWQQRTKLIIFPGNEIDFNGKHHTCVVQRPGGNIHYTKFSDQKEIVARNYEAGALVTLNHPDWEIEEHYTASHLLHLNPYTGIEIYNSVVERLDGASLSTAKWDRLLDLDKRVLGFANQDFHRLSDAIDCCNVVMVREKIPDAIFNALQTGCFYCYYGVSITDIGRKKDTVFVKTKNAQLIRFVGNGGIIFKKMKGKSGSFNFKDLPEVKYIRVECLGFGEAISWSQPFFRV